MRSTALLTMATSPFALFVSSQFQKVVVPEIAPPAVGSYSLLLKILPIYAIEY
jgi:hypothetical protein